MLHASKRSSYDVEKQLPDVTQCPDVIVAGSGE